MCVKSVFGLFLLYDQGGYVLDTNVIFEEKFIPPPANKSVRIPAFANPPQSTFDVDVWMIYSPKGNRRIKSSLDKYLKMWFDADKNIYNKKGYVKKYFLQCGTICVQSILLTKSGKFQPNLKGVSFWRSKVHPKIFDVTIPLLGIKKYYYNSHKAENYFSKDGLAPQLFFEILYNNSPNVLKFLIENGEDVNRITNIGGKDVTPLHVAVQMNRKDMLLEILKHSPDTSKKAVYGNFLLTPLELARKEGKTELYKLILNYENSLLNKIKSDELQYTMVEDQNKNLKIHENVTIKMQKVKLKNNKNIFWPQEKKKLEVPLSQTLHRDEKVLGSGQDLNSLSKSCYLPH